MNDPLLNSNLPEQADDKNQFQRETTQALRETSSIASGEAGWFFGQSDRGKVRQNNEDQFFMDGGRNLFIVADGMGGHAAGEVASLIAVEALDHFLTPDVITSGAIFSDLENELGEALRRANNAVKKASENQDEWRGMGSTAVVALLHGDTLFIANVGDSRAYLLRSSELQMLSKDHSVAAVLAEQNQISREEVRTHPLRNRLTVCLGIQERIEPFTNSIAIQPGDRILLCSDGLWDMLPDDEITRLWNEQTMVEKAVTSLIAAANGAGGQDNVTIAAIDIHERSQFSVEIGGLVESLEPPSLDDTIIVAS